MTAEVIGAWISIFLTICIFSYLYGDNPVYKLAEHLFVGVSIGVAVIETWFATLYPNLVAKLLELPAHPGDIELWSYFVPLILLVLLFFKLSNKLSYLARIPIAFLVAAFAAIKVTGEARSNLLRQLGDSIPDLPAVYAQHGFWNWEANGAGVFSSLLIVVGLGSCLFYFYFSAPHTGVLKPISRFAVWVLMVAFGASFGLTVMGRVTLAFGRGLELLGIGMAPDLASRVHAPVATAVSIVVVGVIVAAHRLVQPPPPPPEDEDDLAVSPG